MDSEIVPSSNDRGRFALPSGFAPPPRGGRGQRNIHYGPPKRGWKVRTVSGPGYCEPGAAKRYRGRLTPVTSEVAIGVPGKVSFGTWWVYVTEFGLVGIVFVHDSNDSWSRSLARALERARSMWVQITPDRSTCTFVVEAFDAVGDADLVDGIPHVEAVIDACFGDRVISTTDDARLS